MRRRETPRNLQRRTRFETFEEKLALSAQPVGDFLLEAHANQQLEHHYGDLAPTESVAPIGDFNRSVEVSDPSDGASGGLRTQLYDAHKLTGVDDVYQTYGIDGAGQTVAIIDSGVAYDHEALGGGFGTSYRVVGGWDFAENDANPYDDGPAGFHGTHVAGIVGSDDLTHRGVASGADLVALRVFDDNGAGYLTWVEDALRWVHDNRNAFENPITTVNLSLGTSWNADSIPAWATLEDEFAQLEQDGIFVAVSAGNSFAEYLTPGLSYPAASPHVIPIASVDDHGVLSQFSQRNDRVLAAPGDAVTSTVPDFIFGADGNHNDFGKASGTSMAAPYAAGVSTLVRQAMELVGVQNINQNTIYDHLRATADVFYDATTSASYHRINVQAALEGLIPADDFGSTAGAAQTLQTINGAASVSGMISTLADTDYFTFTASETGSATFRVDARQNLAADVRLIGGAQSNSGPLTFDIVAGQRYTLSVGTSAGLGYYDAELSVETRAVSPPPTTQPPTTQPPISQPPITQPPTSKLPTTGPPATAPPFVGPKPPTQKPPSAGTPAPELVADATALLNTTTWNDAEAIERSAHHGGFVGDDLVAVDVTGSYQLSGWARSGNGAGGQYQSNNLQFFGFVSYDMDERVILPQHVSKVEGAVDTRLARTLRPGDTQIVLEDASGWSNDGPDDQRSFAWYGYTDSTGHTYEDYTYTRNLRYKDAWDVGAIDYRTNTITLSTPWDGPAVSAGTAARNARSGGTYNYAALVGSVADQWTHYEATISGVSSTAASGFRPGTAFINPLVLTNYHGQDGNLVSWRDVEIRSDARFAAGDQVELAVTTLDVPNATYAWKQLSGPAVELVRANTAHASFTAPQQSHDYSLSFQVTASAAGFTSSDTVTIGVTGNDAGFPVGTTLDATTWSGTAHLTNSARFGVYTGDRLVAVDVAEAYQLSGWARSGDGAGGQYQTNNLQFFGFTSYDVDGEVILPQHVSKVEGAQDTRLAQSLRPGDTQIVLEDARGWSNHGAEHERSLAWYGYSDSTGKTYEDYTYTRNLKYKDAWDVGAINYETNTITLRTAWNGPEISAGTAVRNASSGGTYNYAGLVGSVGNRWTQYEATISGVSATDAHSFRPGTAYIKPLVLTNYHGQDGNLVTWKDVEVRADGGPTTARQGGLTMAGMNLSRTVSSATDAWSPSTGSLAAMACSQTSVSSFTEQLSGDDFRLDLRDAAFRRMVSTRVEADLQVGPRRWSDSEPAVALPPVPVESQELSVLDQMFSELDHLFD